MSKSDRQDERKNRLSAALKSNLAKRKAQARARRNVQYPEAGGPSHDTGHDTGHNADYENDGPRND